MRLTGIMLALLALVFGTAAPASAAEGELRWTSDGVNWYSYTPPAYDVCFEPASWMVKPAIAVVNDTNVAVEAHWRSDCLDSSPDIIRPGERIDSYTVSVYIPAA
ncbi:hypothetical protein LG943_27535 [Streptomonospora sp. S1-112]|uniref:Uncharacterized protein n=1 Tax=Streptomonospora mangrovi TaxID=2883123 RepID=A0A9X3NU46_9ACTN|nr:hypothetical protein [Streptomonospora mangrovi]MDA0568044.1 hypothetical protein [Streptomonospora mangrovi]